MNPNVPRQLLCRRRIDLNVSVETPCCPAMLTAINLHGQATT